MGEATNIIRILGGEKVVGRKIKTADDLVALVHRGLPYESFRHVTRSLGGGEDTARVAVLESKTVTRHAASGAIKSISKPNPFGIPARTLARRRTEHRLSPEESDRVLRVARILARAQEVFGSDDRARRWLAAPCRALGGKVPVELLDTDLGAKTVDDEITRIAHGVFA